MNVLFGEVLQMMKYTSRVVVIAVSIGGISWLIGFLLACTVSDVSMSVCIMMLEI